jgi:ABC-type transport system involved in multi-copper enzyme maturation permease subunit
LNFSFRDCFPQIRFYHERSQKEVHHSNMRLHPVIIRELRAEARNPANYWMRAAVAALAAAVFLAVSLFPGRRAELVPGVLFSCLNGLMYLALCVLVPVLTADCLSREKREGTLGLLFLTPLTAQGIVLAKSVSHALRSLSLVLVVLPVMALVFLLGGVGWKQVVLALMLDVNALMMGLAAGILASALNREWGRSAALALLLFFIMGCASLMLLVGSFVQLSGLPEEISFWDMMMGAALLLSQIGTLSQFPVPATWWDNLMLATVIASLATFLMLALTFSGTARLLGRSWQDRPLSVRQERRRDFFCSPRFWRARLKSRTRRSLDANPMAWLQQYSWQARLTKWGWCLVFICLELFVVSSTSVYVYDYAEWQLSLAGLLVLGLGFSAAASFMRERRNGAMELILVTPLTVSQVVAGRLKGISLQFLPALCILATAVAAGPANQRPPLAVVLVALGLFAVQPLAGLYFSLRQKRFLSAWIMAMLATLGIPALGGLLMAAAFVPFYLTFEAPIALWEISQAFAAALTGPPCFWAMLLTQGLLATWLWRQLNQVLQRRTFTVNLT